jgi:hypothetical protein
MASSGVNFCLKRAPYTSQIVLESQIRIVIHHIHDCSHLARRMQGPTTVWIRRVGATDVTHGNQIIPFLAEFKVDCLQRFDIIYNGNDKRSWAPERNAIGSHACSSFKRTCVRSNGILECKLLSEKEHRTNHNPMLLALTQQNSL